MIIIVVLLILAGLGVGIYFLVNAKKCKDHETQDECKEPCQWDTYGNKCVDEDDDLTPAPPSNPPSDPSDSAPARRSSGPWDRSKYGNLRKREAKCYAGRYEKIQDIYKKDGLEGVGEYYKEFGKPLGENTSCTLTDEEALCYSIQNKEVFDGLGTDRNKLKKHYKDYGQDKVARFSCQGGKFLDTELPPGAKIMYKGRTLPVGTKYFTSDGKWYLSQQGDNNLVWVKAGTPTAWSLGSHTTGNGNVLNFQGDGNLCVYGSQGTKCTMTNRPGPSAIVMETDGDLYVDGGTNDEENRKYLYESDD